MYMKATLAISKGIRGMKTVKNKKSVVFTIQ